MQRLVTLFLLGLVTISAASEVPQNQVLRADYLAYAKDAAEQMWGNYENNLEEWRKNVNLTEASSYHAPWNLIPFAFVSANLYSITGETKYLQWAKKSLLDCGEAKTIVPEKWRKTHPVYKATGVPAIPSIFNDQRYFRAYERIKPDADFTESENEKIEGWIAESAEYNLATQEWGAMNRGSLRADYLAWAARVVPHHPRANVWRMYAKAIADDSWGQWQIEDATGYHGLWLYSMMSYAKAVQDSSFYQAPEMYYYFHYFLNLLAPSGSIVDFGDAHPNIEIYRFIVFFETGAAVYKNPQFKWAANWIISQLFDLNRKNKGISYAAFFLDAYNWGTDDVKMAKPTALSQEVMEDVQGKKIVFRNGWDEKSTFMLLNYRDEGDGGLLGRDNLRNSIAVEEEKMTHGHADENSICHYMNDGCVLLRDGGYRDFMPSGLYGAYRQDYFHNRVCVRQEKIWMGQKQGEHRYMTHDAVPQQPVLEFLRNAGSYRRVRTQKVDFLTFDDWDMSRTRLIDEKLGYEWDRVINYVKNPEMFIVFDIVKATTEEYFTAANLWHTRKIVSQGEHWYDTVYDSLGSTAFPTHKQLLIYFPDTDFKIEGVETERRNYQNEFVIHQTAAQHFFQQDYVVFTTILVPHDQNADIEKILKSIQPVKIDAYPRAVGVKIRDANRDIYICTKTDLQADLVRDNTRPRYTYEAGKIQYDDFETDANNLFVIKERKKMEFVAVNTVQLLYKGKHCFKPSFSDKYGLRFDGKPAQFDRRKFRYWKDVIQLED